MSIHKGEILLVSGPCQAKLFSGKAHCLGKGFKELIVRKGKSLPIETEEEIASIKLTLYETANYEIHKGGIGYSIWKDELKKYYNGLGKEIKTIAVLGPTDSGKSTLTVILSNLALSQKIKVGIIDGDIGQADLTPPCFIGCKLLKEELFDLRDTQADFILPIGFVDVSLNEELVIESIKKGKDLLKDAELIIINTDGFIEGAGLTYKIKMLKELQPDLIFLIDNENLKNAFSNLGIKLATLSAPKGVMKSKETRIQRREMQYAKFISTNNRIVLEIKNLNLGFLGKKFSGWFEEGGIYTLYDETNQKMRIFHSEESTIIVNSAFKSINLPLSAFENMLVGIEKEGKIQGFGIIEKIIDNKIRLITDMKPKIDTLWLTVIKLINWNEQKIRILRI
ncbi:MAG TPA: polynucleotide 5'-hydroxyl-kinase [Geobacterales bacterium]|nr:polynucleotide 5'-hydroxyl-kinase [Geobacterales bacterium]